MPFVLIKNNLKLMLRSKWIIFMMIILPLVTIALLSNAFKDLLDTSYEIGKFKIGYRMDDGSSYKEMLPSLKSACESRGLVLQEYPQGDIENLLKKNIVDVFVDVSDHKTCTLYESSDKKIEAAVTESIFTSFFYQINEVETVSIFAAKNNITGNRIPKEAGVTYEVLKTDPLPSAIDYYGIIYIVYFAWCGMVSLVAVISSERKSAILKRMRVSHMAKWKYYAGKFLPCTLAVLIEVCTAWILSVFFFDIHWGRIGLSLLIVTFIAMAASAFGIILFQLFHNVAVSITVGFVLIWIAGFFGGSFQTYMYADLPEKLVNLSPIYYINRTLVEFSTKGYSDYTYRCFAYLIGIILVCVCFGTLLMNRKLEEQ